MTIQQIGYFLKLSEELNFTTVARVFFITQPTLSRQIVNMENELKVTLFNRDHNTVKLTNEGKILYERLKPLFLELMDAIREVQNIAESNEQLVIGIQEEQIISSALLLAINRLRYEYPDLKISIHRCQTEELVEGLCLGKYDLANMLCFPNIKYQEELVFQELENESSCIAFSSQMEVFEGKTIVNKEETAEFLQKVPLIFPRIYANMDDYNAKKMLQENLGVEKANIEVIQSGRPISLPVQVSAQLGVSICNESNVFSMDSGIRLVKIDGTSGQFIKGLFYRKQPGNLYLKELIRLVREEQKKIHENLC